MRWYPSDNPVLAGPSVARFAVGDRVTHCVYGPGTIVEAAHLDDTDPVHVWARYQDDAGAWRSNMWRGGFVLPQGAFEAIT